jgi:membrane protease YdiL (CAAX protease family)
MTPAPEKPLDKLGIALRVGLFFIIGWITLNLSAWLMYGILGQPGIFVISALASFTAAAVANAITVRIYERGRLSDLGLAWTTGSLREFGMGTGIAFLGAALILGGSLAVGIAQMETVPGVEHPVSRFVFASVVLLFGAAGEEILFRGYAFQLLIRRLGPFATILPVSILFGLGHADNPNAGALAIVNTVMWGVLLGYSYLRTKALWLPIGLHFGWNLALPLFGASVSGLTIMVTGYGLHWRAGDLWSGGGYGPEGGLLTTVIVVVLFFAIHRLFPQRLSE